MRLFLVLLSLLTAGCASYSPRPIDPAVAVAMMQMQTQTNIANANRTALIGMQNQQMILNSMRRNSVNCYSSVAGSNVLTNCY